MVALKKGEKTEVVSWLNSGINVNFVFEILLSNSACHFGLNW